MSQSPGNHLTAQAEQFFPGATIEPVGARSWLSQATTPDGQYSVRRLDPSLPATRVALIHEYLGRPELQAATALVRTSGNGAASFDARTWVAGSTLGISLPRDEWRSLHMPAPVETDILGSVATSLGRLHASGSTESLVARTPQYRVKDALASVRRAIELDERALAGEIRKESRARRWLTASRALLSNAETNLEQVGFLRDEADVIAHLDLWGSHIVRSNGDGSTFLDFSRISSAPAVVDLAQLIARNGAWSDERVEHVLNSYAQANAVQPLQRRVLPWLTALDAIASCGQLLVRAEDERRPLSDSDRRKAWAGADQQLDLLESLSSKFVPRPHRHYRGPGRRTKTQ